MPLYLYQCEFGHKTEKLFKIKERPDRIYTCDECLFLYGDEGHTFFPAEWIQFVLTAEIKTSDDSSKSFVYFQNKKGEVDFTSTPNVYHKPGFEKKEARNLFERESIEKKLREQDDLRLSIQSEKEDYTRHYSTKRRHSDLRHAINQGTIVEKDKDGNSINIPIDNQTGDFIKLAMERSNKIAPKRRNSELKFDINHNDKSNRGTKE